MVSLNKGTTKNLNLIFLFSLVLLLLFSPFLSVNCSAQGILNTDFKKGLSNAYASLQGDSQYIHTEDGKNHPVANEEGEFLSTTSMILASNSIFPMPRGDWLFVRVTTFIAGWYPDKARLILTGADGNTKLKYNVPIANVKHLESNDWWNPFKTDAFAIYLNWNKIDNVKIPALAGAGSWKLTFQVWQATFWERGHVNFVSRANVGQSSLIDTISAPIYIYNEGFLGMGEFGVSLPSILTFAAIPILLGSIYVLFHIWFGSFKAGMKIIKEKMPEIRRKKT